MMQQVLRVTLLGLLGGLGLVGWLPLTDASLSCECTLASGVCQDADYFCEANFRKGSICHPESKVCTNPLAQGCLRTMLGLVDGNGNGNGDNKVKDLNEEGWTAENLLRVCNSDDAPTAAEEGLCLHSPFNYTEIRIHHSNWESSIFYAWIVQIILSEILHVPVSVGYNRDSTYEASFYHHENSVSYSPQTYPWEALLTANRVPMGDCLKTDEDCTHVFPETWNGQDVTWTSAHSDGSIDTPEGNGMVGKISLYIPAFVSDRDPTLVSFYGLRGEQNRQKLASTFKQPTTWKEYCDLVSPTSCSEPDTVAERYPEEGEEGKYFAGADAFIGHFRDTEKNNCTANPTTCMGHIVGPPCTWTTFLESQLYWNDIALESNGPNPPTNSYGYGSMIQIWRAAVATESNVIMWWWKPDATIEEFRGGPGEFQQILLPEATDACAENRVSEAARCSADIWERRGDVMGSCDSEAHSLRKIVASVLRLQTDETPWPLRSPAYDTIANLKVSDLEMNRILKRWINRGVDTYGYDTREAVCSWVAENIGDLMNAIPETYPRTMSDGASTSNDPRIVAAKAMGYFAVVAVLVVSFYTFKYRQSRVFIYAQVNFCFLILTGLLLSSCAAIIYSAEPSQPTCTSTQWCLILGFTLELTPLFVKVAAINRIQQAAKRYKRVNVEAKDLYMAVFAVFLFVLSGLITWTVLDPPTLVQNYVISKEDDTLVESSRKCASESNVWILLSFGWMGMLLIMTTVLAFQSRNVTQRFNETKSLVSMIYAHFLFKILGFAVYVMSDALDSDVLPIINSFLLTADTLVVLGVYFAPKLRKAFNPEALEADQPQTFSEMPMSVFETTTRNGQRSNENRLQATNEEGEEEDGDDDATDPQDGNSSPSQDEFEDGTKNLPPSYSKRLAFDGTIEMQAH